MLAGKSGVALFPANMKDPQLSKNSNNIKIDHFAFHVTQENFKKAKEKYDALQLNYSVSDHHYFHSLYTKDPDGHTVELTTLMVNAAGFYK
jgi:catechol-2,3-dioxygenase